MPPNIVVLVADDLSPTGLGCYGNPHVRTPHLNRLAAEGIRFERAYTTSPQCSPSRSSLFTSRSPHATGTSRLHSELRPTVPTIVESLCEAGYYTGLYRKHHLGLEFPSRFDFAAADRERFETFFSCRPKNQPFFLWVGFHDPHRDLYRNYGHIRKLRRTPHLPAKVTVPPFLPDTPAMRRDLALHYDAIQRLDRDCGRILRLLEQQNAAENTLVVFLSDHGMPYPRAKATLYEAGINIPLLVRWPGRITPGRVCGELVSSVDLPSTWLDLVGGIPLPYMEGQSLRPLLEGRPHRPRTRVFVERNWHDTWEPARGVVTETHSLICNCRPEVSYRGSLDHLSSPPWGEIVAARAAGRLRPELEAAYFGVPRPSVELYDLQRDPAQLRNLAGDPRQAPRIRSMLRALDQWMRDTNDFLPPPATFPQIKVPWKLTMERMLDGPLPHARLDESTSN